MNPLPRLALIGFAALASATLDAQTPAAPPPALAQVHSGRLSPNYPVPYEPASTRQIKAVGDRILAYLETASPIKIIDRDTQQPVTDLTRLPARPAFARTEFLITSYEWGVTYSGMLHLAAVTNDSRYRDYTASRLDAIAAVATQLKSLPPPPADAPPRERMLGLRSVIAPRSLDDSGSMGVAMIKAARAGVSPDALRPWIDNYLEFISTSQFRLADGTLARNRPLHNSLWLDDLYMSVPALAQMGVLTNDGRYFDDAVKQITQFAARMFVPEKNLWRHGWVQEMKPHPSFHWARANGWAVVAIAELLSVLPEDHPGRAEVLEIYHAHVAGLAATQGKTGLWHQLLDRNDSYLETSASAMFVYSIARGINRGWLDPLAYGPMVSLGWNAVAQQVNATGQVENVCIGTGMGFDPAFYYHRPVSVYAAHGFGPVLLACAEMITLFQGKGTAANINDSSLQFAPSPSRH